MNILVLNFEYPPLGGGASPVCHEINKRYVIAGHAVTVVSMLYAGLADQEQVDGVSIIRIPCRRAKVHMCSPFEQWTFLANAKKFLRQWLPGQSIDIVHAHFILPTGLLCRFVKKTFGIPFIITAHGSDIPGFNPDRFRFLHLWTPPVIQAIIALSAYITSPSLYLKNLIVRVAPSQAEKILVIPNGIDALSFLRSAKKPVLVSSGRLLKRKGFLELIRAVKSIALPLEVHILGDGPLRKQLEAEAFSSMTPIHFHGWVDNRSATYRELLGSAAVYSLVSRRENASISILEAMASGCAVITAEQSGCPEMVGDAGILVPPGNVAALQHSIQRLAADTSLQSELGDKAYQRVLYVYNWDTLVNMYLQLLAKVIQSGRQ